MLLSDSHSILAKRFWVDDVPGSLVPGSRLSNLLHRYSLGKSLSPLGLRFLDENGFKRLVQFISNEISEAQFHQFAPIEQSTRVDAAFARQKAAEQQLKVDQEAAEARHAAMMARLHAERLQRESDPKFIVRQKIASCEKAMVLMASSTSLISGN